MSMCAIAIFVKTPNLSPLKTRLAAGIGRGGADMFYDLSLRAIEETLSNIDGLYPHWAVGEQDGLNHPLWQKFPAFHTGNGDLGMRQYNVYRQLFKKHDKVLLIGADAPQISSDHIQGAIHALEIHDFVIGPAHDGGYYLFGGRIPTDKSVWNNITWSAETTRQELESKLGTDIYHLPFLTDIDHKNDLDILLTEMPNDKNEAQINLIDWIQTL